MAWSTITPDEVKWKISSAEFDAAQTYDLASGQTDPLPEVISLTLAEVRGYIPRSCIDPDPTLIPPELKDTALVLAREKAIARLAGGDCSMTEVRSRELEFAMQRLRDTAASRFYIESGVASEEIARNEPSDDVTGGNAVIAFGGEGKLEF
jgi:hypothetical protein